MKKRVIVGGFSFVEILISLFIVSITAVNITRLQQMVGGQGRDNFIYGVVLKLATEKMENTLQLELIADLDALDGSQEVITENQTELALEWHISTPTSQYDAGVNVRDVVLQISWEDSKGDQQAFNYREQVNLMQLLEMDNGTADIVTLESVLKTNDIIYFESQMGYKEGAFVIYNSELFKATEAHLIGNDYPRDIEDPSVVSEGWESYGLINNPQLAENADLVALF